MAGTAAPAAVGAERVLLVLTELAENVDGATLDELSRALASPKPTVHRALAILCKLGLARRLGRGSYILGDEFLRLAALHRNPAPAAMRVEPILAELAATFGEMVVFDELDGRDIVVRAKADPPDASVRLSMVVGGRYPSYNTASGKLLLAAQLPDLEAVREWIGPRGLQRSTHATLADAWSLSSALDEIRAIGYAIDDQESELGVNSVSLPVALSSSGIPAGAISIVGLAFRTPLTDLVAAVPYIRELIRSHGL
ncbi:IclR family transcriptional regulator [Microbacteriaceae bacterium VKM Ac-2854]|nr:IclR family transcriptional regulator [Microbacteriaceae bacterium VKM Ac-2854]